MTIYTAKKHYGNEREKIPLKHFKKDENVRSSAYVTGPQRENNRSDYKSGKSLLGKDTQHGLCEALRSSRRKVWAKSRARKARKAQGKLKGG